MDLPPSSLLGRLEAFLPEMEKANQTTEKLAQEGKLEVLDGSLEVAGTDQPRETVEGTDEEDGDKEEEQEEGEGEGAAAPPRTVQLVSAFAQRSREILEFNLPRDMMDVAPREHDRVQCDVRAHQGEFWGETEWYY